MKEIKIPAQQGFDEEKEKFVLLVEETKLRLEHSLVSMSKWESKWHKPFLGKKDKTEEEILDYIRCMTINKNVDPNVYNYIPQDVFESIMDYIENPMTATWFSKTDESKTGIRKKEVITSEIVYYWMVTLGIPLECEKWHLNRLITLIRVINVKNTPPKKMSKENILRGNKKLNNARKARYKSRG